jgi:hypothetical protein
MAPPGGEGRKEKGERGRERRKIKGKRKREDKDKGKEESEKRAWPWLALPSSCIPFPVFPKRPSPSGPNRPEKKRKRERERIEETRFSGDGFRPALPRHLPLPARAEIGTTHLPPTHPPSN